MLHSRAAVTAISVRAGSSFHGSGGSVFNITTGYVHGSYDSATLDYDVGVIHVSTPFDLGSYGINTVPLLLAGNSPLVGTTAYVSGWGTTSVRTENV